MVLAKTKCESLTVGIGCYYCGNGDDWAVTGDNCWRNDVVLKTIMKWHPVIENEEQWAGNESKPAPFSRNGNEEMKAVANVFCIEEPWNNRLFRAANRRNIGNDVLMATIIEEAANRIRRM